jgi:hypothetical protein
VVTVGGSAPSSGSVLGTWAPSPPPEPVGRGLSRPTAPGAGGLPAAARPADLELERDPASVLALSDALGAALGEECDLRGLEEA